MPDLVSRRRDFQIFLTSFLILFLEIALIRWISTEIRIFAYVNNLVLLACFLGMGVGCGRSDSRASLAPSLGGLLILCGALLLPVKVPLLGKSLHPFRDTPTMLSVFADSPIWFEFKTDRYLAATLMGIASTLAVFVLVFIIFIPLGRRLGGLMAESPEVVRAYSLNVAAGLLGMWVFAACSFAYLPPWVWLGIGILGLGVLPRRGWREGVLLAFLTLAVAAMAFQRPGPEARILWSPYQKLEIEPLVGAGIKRGYFLQVNNIGYMALMDLSDRFLAEHPTRLTPELRALSQYDLPYRLAGEVRKVLIVGAGGGNDAAGALRHGAEEVTAVEIDPGIVRLGRELHPEAPYSSPRVQVVVDDARAFFRRAHGSYDLISFGLLDSHTLASSYNNTRLDHYVYTVESFREARSLLGKGGTLTVSFETPRPWVGGRIAADLRAAFGMEPLVFKIPATSYGWGGTLFVVSLDPERLRRTVDAQPDLRSFIEAHPPDLERPGRPATDDWPYLYLEKPRIPRLHLTLSAILLLLFAAAGRRFLPGRGRMNLHFFFLGAAFLLLEFQNITKSSLLFGSTWLVSALTISGILVLILLANLASRRWHPRLGVLYGLLLGSVILSLLLPLEAFNSLGYLPRGILASLLLNLPVFFAGMVFIRSFAGTGARDAALGSNLLGAGAGGLLESLSFVVGVKPLLVLVALFYALSWARRP